MARKAKKPKPIKPIAVVITGLPKGAVATYAGKRIPKSGVLILKPKRS